MLVRLIDKLRSFNPGSLIWEELCRICKKPVEQELVVPLGASPTLMCICKSCEPGITLARSPFEQRLPCEALKEEVPVLWAASYEGEVQRLVRRLKYDDDRLIARDLAVILLRRILDCEEPLLVAESGPSILVPVPLHWRKQRKRGFNQSDLICMELGRHLGIRVDKKALRRSRRTRAQFGLSRTERISNVSGAFEAVVKRVTGKSVVLLDDVITSGATISQCAAAVTVAGARSVSALAFARAPLR